MLDEFIDLKGERGEMGEITDLQKVRKQNDYSESAARHLNNARDILNDVIDNIGALSPEQQYRSALAVWSTVWLVRKSIEEKQVSLFRESEM